VAVDPENSQKVMEAYLNSGIRASVIGRIEERSFGTKFLKDGKKGNLKWSEKDEITRIFE
jgi:hydrogenase maturation factor HypE